MRDANFKVGPFNPAKISASRVNKYLGCGVEFRRYYIDGEPEQRSGSAALFGNVVHKALETWALNRSQDLVTLMAQAWLEVTEGTTVRDFLGHYQRISVDVMKAEASARASFEKRNPGKESKAPRMTKEFKQSDAAKRLYALVDEWLPKLEAGSPWKFSERDPLPNLYDESLILGKKYAAKWRHLPAAIHTEFAFDVEWNGFRLTGYIDNIEPYVVDGELIAYQTVDYKTYAKEPAEQKDWRQGVIYEVAVTDLRDRGILPLLPDVPIVPVFDYVRLGFRRDFRYTEADRSELLRELTLYRRGVDAEIFLPADKSRNPDFCSYPDNCCLRSKGEGCGQRGGLYQEAA